MNLIKLQNNMKNRTKIIIAIVVIASIYYTLQYTSIGFALGMWLGEIKAAY